MRNSLYNQLNQNQPLLNNFQMNPQIQSMLQMVKNSGMSAKDLFYAKAKEMGVDPNTILSQLR